MSGQTDSVTLEGHFLANLLLEFGDNPGNLSAIREALLRTLREVHGNLIRAVDPLEQIIGIINSPAQDRSDPYLFYLQVRDAVESSGLGTENALAIMCAKRTSLSSMLANFGETKKDALKKISKAVALAHAEFKLRQIASGQGHLQDYREIKRTITKDAGLSLEQGIQAIASRNNAVRELLQNRNKDNLVTAFKTLKQAAALEDIVLQAKAEKPSLAAYFNAKTNPASCGLASADELDEKLKEVPAAGGNWLKAFSSAVKTINIELWQHYKTIENKPDAPAPIHFFTILDSIFERGGFTGERLVEGVKALDFSSVEEWKTFRTRTETGANITASTGAPDYGL